MRRRALSWVLVGALAGVLAARPSGALEIEGTADLELSIAEGAAPVTFVSLAGFSLTALEGRPGTQFIAVAELGPDDVIDGSADFAGQLWVEVPRSRLTPGSTVGFEAGRSDLVVAYDEWTAGGRTHFEGQAQVGWVDIRIDLADGTIAQVDVVLEVLVVDERREQQRILSGVLFGGQPAAPEPAPSRPPDRRVGRQGGGCGGDGEVVVVAEEPYGGADDSGGCGDDGYGTTDYSETSSSSGCEGDSLDSGSGPSSSADGGCGGDEMDTASDTSTQTSSGDSGPACEGDSLDKRSRASLIPLGRRLGRPRLWRALARQTHLWVPLLVVIFGRRRVRETHRDRGVTAPASAERPAARAASLPTD